MCRTRWDQEGLDPAQPLLRVGLANRRRDTPYEGMPTSSSPHAVLTDAVTYGCCIIKGQGQESSNNSKVNTAKTNNTKLNAVKVSDTETNNIKVNTIKVLGFDDQFYRYLTF